MFSIQSSVHSTPACHPGSAPGVPAFCVGSDVGSKGAQVPLRALPPGRVHGLAYLVSDFDLALVLAGLDEDAG
ncbi:hypothetical protein ACIRQP_30655 [Streptomyces sp. NPDC102274]|uniref:hypothetical protein n=1 Tax=Streptomyces sp. NPDC102274 TaxID=3366151 RepID=UPI00382CD6F9